GRIACDFGAKSGRPPNRPPTIRITDPAGPYRDGRATRPASADPCPCVAPRSHFGACPDADAYPSADARPDVNTCPDRDVFPDVDVCPGFRACPGFDACPGSGAFRDLNA